MEQGSSHEQAERVAKGSRPAQAVVLQGTPYQRGLAHGETLRSEIQAVVSLWQEALERDFRCPATEVIRRFLAGTDFVPPMQAWTPGLPDEIRGIADGAGLGHDTLLAYQLLDEMWNNADAIVGEHCSTLGIPPGRSELSYLAQTVDVEHFRDGFQVVLHIRHPGSDLESLVVTCAGLVGFNGMNNHGIGVGVNALMQLNPCRDGLPVAAVVRGLLEQRTLEEAIAFVQKVRHASGQNYLVGAPAGIAAFECSANAVVPLEPQGPGGVIWHTNHPVSSTDYQPWFQNALDSGAEMPLLENSRTRYQSLARKLETPLPNGGVEALQGILATRDDARHPISSAGEKGEFYSEVGLFSFASTIMVLSDDPVLHVAPGPPDRTPYQRFSF